MKIKESSWLLKYAYMWSEYGIPAKTSLCALFWRTVGVTTLFWMVATLVIFTLIIMGKNPLAFLIAVGIVLGALAVVASIGGTVKLTSEYLQGKRGEDSTLWQVARAAKGKFCPIIDIVPNRE